MCTCIGVSGNIYSIISAHKFGVNGRFKFLSRSSFNADTNINTVIPREIKHTQLYTHPGSYITELSILYKNMSVELYAGMLTHGFQKIKVNEELMTYDSGDDGVHDNSKGGKKCMYNHDGMIVNMKNKYTVHIQLPMFEMNIVNSDRFLNMENIILITDTQHTFQTWHG